MPVEILVATFEIKATDIIHFKNFYNMFFDYIFREFNFGKRPTSDFPEKYFYESKSPNGKEIWVWWRPVKAEAGSKFVRKKFKIDLHGVAVKDIEIMRNNKKFKADVGKVEVLVKAHLELDYKGMWEKSFLAPMMQLFYKTVYKKILEGYRKDLLMDSYKMQEFVKRIMDINTFSYPTRPFNPPLGLPEEEQALS